MAKRKKKAGKRKVVLRPGQCKIVSTPGGKRKLCKTKAGKVRFRRMSYSPR